MLLEVIPGIISGAHGTKIATTDYQGNWTVSGDGHVAMYLDEFQIAFDAKANESLLGSVVVNSKVMSSIEGGDTIDGIDVADAMTKKVLS